VGYVEMTGVDSFTASVDSNRTVEIAAINLGANGEIALFYEHETLKGPLCTTVDQLVFWDLVRRASLTDDAVVKGALGLRAVIDRDGLLVGIKERLSK